MERSVGWGVLVLVKDGKEVARRWVNEEASAAPGFGGAFFHGSTAWLPEDAVLPALSDLDVIVVFDELAPGIQLGKFSYRGIVLDVSSLPSDEFRSAEHVLGLYHLAGSFRAPSVISDPTGRLTVLQMVVAHEFAQRRWVYWRCENARERVLRNLRSLDHTRPFRDQVTAWLFATGVTTHVLLVAGLKNPTVRRRYAAVNELLLDYGRPDFYETLLGLLGCVEMSRARVEHHLAALVEAFDAARMVIESPFFFASDISASARPIAIDGTRELIERGQHREAVFWLVATYARCQQVLSLDAPAEVRDRHDLGFRRLLADLGIESPADLRRRAAQVEDFLPQLWEVAEAIIAANPGIEVAGVSAERRR